MTAVRRSGLDAYISSGGDDNVMVIDVAMIQCLDEFNEESMGERFSRQEAHKLTPLGGRNNLMGGRSKMVGGRNTSVGGHIKCH